MNNQDEKSFKIAHKEAKIGIALVIFNFIWWFGFAYGLGSSDPTEYTYIIGLPAWFFYSCVVGLVVMIVLVTLCVRFLFKEVTFEEEEQENE